ncbi:hypothetical protein HC251_24180 [Iamia sp. SCSIO 61187]|uniref:hypothetical protein n=1 Tax=Iamia sp. SCSIO 61187 TaxID=2722752 RepID=UPI001C63409E|nr:hypothetical protein [Iamia sp. SCSIO 61187]QYG95221.1 hypothetical protein HC251_24180 [Iamia sp. SCSIO 61187]
MPVTPVLHVGAPSVVGPLTVFPVWTDAPVPCRPVRIGVPRTASVGELVGAS